MFCPECGKKNKENALFCEDCGYKLAQEKTSKVKKEKPEVKKELPKKNKILIGIIGVIIVGLVVSYVLISKSLDPKNIAEKYFNAVVSNDADELYDILTIEKSEFTTKSMLKKALKEQKKLDVVNYTVNKMEKSTDGLTATVNISYTIKNIKKTKEQEIYLTKQKKKKWLLFDNWQVVLNDKTTTDNYSVKVLKGSVITIEGTKLDKKYLDKNKSTDTYDVYDMPSMFTLKYSVSVKLPIGIEIEDYMNVYDFGIYTSSLSLNKLSEKFKKDLTNTIKTNLQTIYDSAKDNKTFDDVKSNFEYKDADLSDIKSDYESLVSSLSTTSNKLTTISFKEITLNSLKINEDGYLYVSVKAKYDYTVSYLSGEETKTNSDNDYDYIYMMFDYKDKAFKLIDSSRLNSYFSRF